MSEKYFSSNQPSFDNGIGFLFQCEVRESRYWANRLETAISLAKISRRQLWRHKKESSNKLAIRERKQNGISFLSYRLFGADNQVVIVWFCNRRIRFEGGKTLKNPQFFYFSLARAQPKRRKFNRNVLVVLEFSDCLPFASICRHFVLSTFISHSRFCTVFLWISRRLVPVLSLSVF